MIVVQYDGCGGNLRTLILEPAVPDGSAGAPVQRNLQKLTDRILSVAYSRR